MKINDLKAGMRIKLRNGDVYVIDDVRYYIITLELIEEDYDTPVFFKEEYFRDLTHCNSQFDIMEVLTMDFHMNWKVIWKRNVGNDDAQDEREYFRKGLLVKHSINIQKEEKGMKELYNLIDKVYFNESKRTTTIKFKDGDISKATATVGTEFCEHAGFMAALFKYQYGKVKDLETFIKRKGERQ